MKSSTFLKSTLVVFFCALALCLIVGKILYRDNCAPTENEFVEKIFVVNTLDNGKKMEEYLAYHKKVWPEVEAGFKKAGYKNITLYRFNDLIVMKIRVPRNADLNKMGKLAESYSPRCAEWNVLMNGYQKGVNGTSKDQKWVEVVPFYEFSN